MKLWSQATAADRNERVLMETPNAPFFEWRTASQRIHHVVEVAAGNVKKAASATWVRTVHNEATLCQACE